MVAPCLPHRTAAILLGGGCLALLAVGCGDDATSGGAGGGTSASASSGEPSPAGATSGDGVTTGAAVGPGGSGGAGGGDATTGGGGGPVDPCDDLAPTADPSANRAAIQACLDAPGGRATLREGAVFDIDAAITVDSGDVLEGASAADLATIRPAVASATFATVSNAILNVVNGSGGPVGGTLRHVRLDMRDARSAGTSLYGVRVAYDDNHVDGVEITSVPMPWRETRAVSLYFGTGHRNLAEDVFIHDAALGVVFVNGNTRAMAPRVDRARILDNRGDAVTFAGYGEVTNSEIRRNGFDDGDSGAGTRLPPGGALYASYVNQEGGRIEGNTIADQCGTNIELNMTRGFLVQDNVVVDPGWPDLNGTSRAIRPGEDAFDVPAGFCKAAMSVLVIATRDSTFRGNTILNVGRPANTSGSSSNGGGEQWFGPAKGDLPAPESTSIGLAFVLGRGHQDGMGNLHYAVGNVFSANVLGSWGAGAAGLGWFAGRGTGFGPGGTWDAQSTANVFDDNTHCAGAECTPAPHSRRCGDNRHGTGEASCAGPSGENLHDGVGSGNRCNRDDVVHEGPGHDARRNDGCPAYD